MMSEPAQKCENQAIFKQNYTLELFIALEMVYYCCFTLGGNLDFLDFLQKKFYNIDYWCLCMCMYGCRGSLWYNFIFVLSCLSLVLLVHSIPVEKILYIAGIRIYVGVLVQQVPLKQSFTALSYSTTPSIYVHFYASV